jgi:Holliday junction resolvase
MTEEQIESCKRWVELETRGEVICRTHAQRTENAAERAKWSLLAELENTTRNALVHYLRENGISVIDSAESRRSGELFAQQSEGVAWLELMTAWRPRIVVYVDELRALASAASASENALTARLLEHEEAWLAFVDRELAGDAATSIEPIRAHLEKWRGRD